jgi:hypothetical protein
MNVLAASTNLASGRNPFREIRWLIWLYFFLLIFEGALRKWAVPSLANALLIVRDPVLLAIYAFAFSRRIFPVNGFTMAIGFLGLASFVASFMATFHDWRVALFGLRCNFLHLPLVFVIGRAFNYNDVRRLGWVMLMIALPMTALVVLQFQSPADAYVNRGAGEDSQMISSINGRIRPSGTFSFVSGIIYFYALTTAFLVFGLVQKRAYPWWLALAAGCALPVGLAVSSSRSTVASCAIVLIAFGVALIARPSLALKTTKLVVIAFAIASVVGGMTMFQEGMEIFQARVEHAAEVEGGTGGFFERAIHQFTRPFSYISTISIVGEGLGSGTNVGARLLTGNIEFLLAEDEWERVMLESGPIFGLAFLLLRVVLTIWIGWLAWRAARAGHFLPMLLFGTCAWVLVNGQFGQSTSLGFAVFMGGITLASMRVPEIAAATISAKQRSARIVPAKVRAQWDAIAARKAAARGEVFPTRPENAPSPP